MWREYLLYDTARAIEIHAITLAQISVAAWGGGGRSLTKLGRISNAPSQVHDYSTSSTRILMLTAKTLRSQRPGLTRSLSSSIILVLNSRITTMTLSKQSAKSKSKANSDNDATFTLFPKLPAEIRQIIWSLVPQLPKIVTIFPASIEDCSGGPKSASGLHTTKFLQC
jgi:hypothetical protein